MVSLKEYAKERVERIIAPTWRIRQMNGAALPQNRGTMEQHPSAKREISRRYATLTQKTST